MKIYELEIEERNIGNYLSLTANADTTRTELTGMAEIKQWIKDHDMIVKIRIETDYKNRPKSFIVKYNKFVLSVFEYGRNITLKSFIFYSQEDYNLFKLTWG